MADEITKANEEIAQLKEQIKTLSRTQIDLSEKRRGWVRVGILGAFFAAFGYVVVKFTGTQEGGIKPETLYSYLTGIISGKIIEHYLNSLSSKSDKFL